MDDDIFQFKAPVYLDFQNANDFNVMGDEFFDNYREYEDGDVSDSTENNSSATDDTSRNSLRRSLSVDGINLLKNKNVNQNSGSLEYLNLNGSSKTNQPQRPISIENIQPKKYECLAEKIRQFHFKTPDRFKSKPKPFQFSKYQPVHTTRPQSPHLTTKMRSRPTHILTAEERERMEMEEIKKHQFKAQEVNKNIFKVPKSTAIAVEKKPITNFEPFNLTEVKKKVAPSKEEFKFQANPVQKKMFESVIGIPEKQPIKSTIPKTPTFMKESRLRSKHLGINSKSGLLEYQDDAHHGIQLHKSPKPTTAKPFNVIKRGEESLKKKEEKIKQIIEAEKKMREFHAKPAPKFLRPKSNSNSDVTSISGNSSQDSNEENSTSTLNTFKARPATVLQKKPFVPILKPRPLIEVQQFQLALDERIKKREEFEQKMKEKEDIKQQMLRKQEELKRLAEKEELNRLRQEAIIKAQPIKKFKEFILRPSAMDLTSPHTPKFSSRIKK